MTMGLKILLHDDGKDATELREEARKRKEVSDTILEIIYNKIISKGKKKDLELERYGK